MHSFKGCTAYTAVLFLAVALRSGGHDDGGGGRRRGGDTLWCNTCSGAEAHATSKTPSPARLVLRTSGTAATWIYMYVCTYIYMYNM